jgi:hypothetical protein
MTRDDDALPTFRHLCSVENSLSLPAGHRGTYKNKLSA